MPNSLNFTQAAAIPVASLTGFQALLHAEKGGMISGPEGARIRALHAATCETGLVSALPVIDLWIVGNAETIQVAV
jgi:hypothetical protein